MKGFQALSLSVSNLSDCSAGLEIIISAACGAISSKNLYLGDLQLVAGSLPLPMAPRPVATETMLVARYLRPCSGLIGKANSATNMQIPLSHPDLRTTPSYEATGALNFTDAVASDFSQSQAGVSTIHDATAHNGRISCGYFSGLTSGTMLIQRGSGEHGSKPAAGGIAHSLVAEANRLSHADGPIASVLAGSGKAIPATALDSSPATTSPLSRRSYGSRSPILRTALRTGSPHSATRFYTTDRAAANCRNRQLSARNRQ